MCLDYSHALTVLLLLLLQAAETEDLECTGTEISSRLLIANVFGKLPHKNPSVIQHEGKAILSLSDMGKPALLLMAVVKDKYGLF